MTEERMPIEPNDQSSDEAPLTVSSELVGSVLAEKYGFIETDTLTGLREEAVKAFNAGERQKYLDLVAMYSDEARRLVSQAEGTGYPYGQLGLMLAEASIRRDTGRWAQYIEDLQDALTFCEGQGYADAATNIELIIVHAQQELPATGRGKIPRS